MDQIVAIKLHFTNNTLLSHPIMTDIIPEGFYYNEYRYHDTAKQNYESLNRDYVLLYQKHFGKQLLSFEARYTRKVHTRRSLKLQQLYSKVEKAHARMKRWEQQETRTRRILDQQEETREAARAARAARV